ncbi:MAG TPA: hypothetical protein VFK48_05785 [Usitatibacter sp.]|nr:hypothetical protein [Usitatibacter sp.]
MNRLTAIGLASLVAYGVLIATKYAGVVSAAPEEKTASTASLESVAPGVADVARANATPRAQTIGAFPAPVARTPRLSPVALEFRSTRDLKAFADGLAARSATLTADERYHLAKAVEECQFVASITEDLAAYSAKQRRQFLSSLPTGDSNNEKRIAAYEAVDNTQRCLGFQNAKVGPKDVDTLYRSAALQGDARAQARLITAELANRSAGKNAPHAEAAQATNGRDDLSVLISLIESGDPEALLIVGDYMSRASQTMQLRVGVNGEVPEPSALLGGFSLAACDLGQDCSALHREPQLACAYGGYCDSSTYEELFQNFLASPWAYNQANRYRALIHTAIRDRNYGLIGLTPKLANRDKTKQ